MTTSRYAMTVDVRTEFLSEHSSEDEGRHVFVYTITIRNSGTVAAQVISRHWIIRDAQGRVEEVKGLGVVGHQPLLEPGASFEYTSGTTLPTPAGTMEGSFFAVATDGTRFDIPIAPFTLAKPHSLH